MIFVTLIADENVFRKLDCDYVTTKFNDLVANVVIVFICTDENWRKEDTWKRGGKTFHTIRLPYQQVKEMEDTRPLMLEMAAKRLGIPVPQMEEAIAA